jgi:hypothetical protein
MGRRRKYNKRRGGPKNEGGGSTPPERKLNMRKADGFEFRLKNLLDGIEGSGTIFGNICSKSVNIGINETINYVEVLVEDSNIEKSKATEIVVLLNKYSTLR